MESDDECDACAVVIVARLYDRSRRTTENRRAAARGGYMRADRLSVDAANQVSLMRGRENKVNLTPGLSQRDPLSFEARISIK